ncbi:MAG: 7-cyano-7-deazaguanine synthase [Parcubacteria group bacterium]|nr:7-cyano-7-deazaguanine synthase [Parcubacteria group bacterium]
MQGEYTRQAIDLVKKEVSAVSDFDGRAVLLFSGGRDSSAVAAAYCNAFPQGQLHLLLIDNGLLSRLDSTKRQANLLGDLFPKADLIFEMERVSQLMRQVGMQEIEADFTQRNFSTLLICLACKLIMNISAIRYAQELEIKVVLDGYADRQKHYPEQTEEFMRHVRQVYQEAGLVYLSPLYHLLKDKDIVNQVLEELGVYIQKQEPICMWADSFSTAKPEEIETYTQRALERIRRINSTIRH